MENYSLVSRVGIRRVIIWGLRNPFHSHHFIHLGFYTTLKKIRFPVKWLEDISSSNDCLVTGDLIITADICMKNLLPRKNVFFCLHNPISDFVEKLDYGSYFFLQVLTKHVYQEFCMKKNAELSGLAFFDYASLVLYQSWGTPMLPYEFKAPRYLEYKKIEFFVGSIWNNDQNQGNELAIQEYKDALSTLGIKFKQIRGCPEIYNSLFVRHAALATAIVGDWQKTHGYTPCRLFKALSYGRLASINSISSKEQYPWIFSNNSIRHLTLSQYKINKKEYIELVSNQQQFLKSETYLSKLSNIFYVFELVKGLK